MFAQNLSGYWKGTLTMQGCFPKNNIELQVNITDTSVSGDSYHYQDVNNYVKKKFRGSYDPFYKTLSLREGLVTTYHIPYYCAICIKSFELKYIQTGNEEKLSGVWAGNILNTNSACPPGTIVLTRIKESAFKEIPEVKVDTGELRLDFYDNAEIDGDSITVLVNKKVVLSHQELSAKPITMFLKIDLNNIFQEIEMVAENLGTIPPNTAILIITAGKKRYRLFLSSTETKSAMVRFVYDEEASMNETDK